MQIVILISLPVSVLIYFLLRKWIIEKGHFGNQTWKGSLWAGVLALPPCAFVAGFVAGLSGRSLPPKPAGGSSTFGFPEMILLLLFVVIVACTVLIIHFISRRFNKSKKDSLTNGQSTAPFSSPEAAGKWTRGLLAATLILAALAVISGALQIELLSRIARGAGYTLEEVSRNDSRRQVLGILQILFFIGTAVAFLIWFHRAYKNLPSLGQRRFVFTPGWAVGFFFVPFLNFVRPFQAMRELWHGSDPGRWELDAPSDGSGIHDRLGTPPLVGWWWALFLVSGIMSNIAARLYLFASGTEVQTAGVLMVVSDLLDIPSALVAIRLVGCLTRWQTEKARLISQRGGQVAMNENPFSGAEVKKNGRKNILLLGAAFLVLPPLVASIFQLTGNRDGNKEPQKVYVKGQYFTVGSTREEVMRIQVPPTFKLEMVWFYGDSQVQFDSDGKVTYIWDYSKNLKAKPEKLP
ncbi:DUF4328 domain-containing protein [Candidatus Bathyarchaeota archaeon]|nr:DUF4328 domain-containing protein [Candidatus Bathyarchaeota archaeon]